MGTVNVNREVTDVFYRYKMPRISAKVEGKGNGIKTVIVNMVDVAKAIGRPATYPTKYFGCELGAQTQFDYKNERFIVNGSHDGEKLQTMLDGFIRKFVLCPACDNPETELLVSTKKQTISQGCRACGFHGPLEVNHKLNTFILKNPPKMDPATQGSSLTEGKRSKRSKKGAEDEKTGNGGASATSNGNHNTSNEGEDEESVSIITVEAPKQVADGDDDDTWTADVSVDAVRARMEDLTDGAKCMTISDDLEKSEKERLDMFFEFVKKKRDAGELDSVAVHKELYSEADRLDVLHKAPLILVELLFSTNIIQEARKHRNLLLRFTVEQDKAQRYLMGGLEQIIALHPDKLMDKVAGILKLFYDLDILDEKTILEWASKVSKKYVSKEVSAEIHEKATPFVKWLKEAEEEESSEEEDDDLEIEYDDRAQATIRKAPTAVKKSAAAAADDDDGEGEEIDIDDI